MLSINSELHFASRVSAIWMNWDSPTSSLCETCINGRLKNKICQTTIRPVAFYGSESWAIIKGNELRLALMQTKIFHWTSGAWHMITSKMRAASMEMTSHQWWRLQ